MGEKEKNEHKSKMKAVFAQIMLRRIIKQIQAPPTPTTTSH
jgi:hypothetical protein